MIPSYADLLQQVRLSPFVSQPVSPYLRASRYCRGFSLRQSKIHRSGRNSDLIRLLARTAQIAVQVFGAVTALGTSGIDVSALVAGLGLTGFALGFAFRYVLSNVLAGVLILMLPPIPAR